MSHKITMYENLRDMLENELRKLEGGRELTREILDEIYKITTSLCYIDEKIEDCKELKWMEERQEMEEEPGASGAHYDSMSYGNRRASYARPRMRRSYGNRTVNLYPPSVDWMQSRDNAKKTMVRKLSTLMDDTMSEEDRAAISDCISRINNS